MKTIAQIKAETELLNLKRNIPSLNSLSKLQEKYVIATLRQLYLEGDRDGFKIAGGILFK